jgi:glycosyltransferase involved in cell wall biosynthesis
MRQLPHIECHICPTSAWETRGLGSEGSRSPDNIHIVKYDHPLAIREAYAKCRFVVIPMRNATTQWSAGCTSVLQPQAMGKPVIATHLPGLAEYLVNGETGMLVAGANPDLMARAIDDLWRNPEQGAAMGRRARQWVESTRSLESSIDQIVDIVDEIG